MKDVIHSKILDNYEKLDVWFKDRSSNSYIPFYSSYDIRDSGFKVANVDGNIFPAGFNNICQTDKDNAPELVQSFVKSHYGDITKILLVTEDHLKNKHYWENVASIQDILRESGFEVAIGMPGLSQENSIEVESFTGKVMQAHRIFVEAGKVSLKDFEPDLVISNNDFSVEYSNWQNIEACKINPPKELGWYQRKKSNYFKHYEQVVNEYCEILNLDPWLFNPQTKLFENFDVTSEASRASLADAVDEMISFTQKKYTENGIEVKPNVFLKNNSGTYGLAVIKVNSGADVASMNYKGKKKMKAAKGGRDVGELIIQEGVPSVLLTDEATAEPAIYMAGPHLVGGFLRTHHAKDASESLNSPGAVYKKLCLSDLQIRPKGCPLENVYGWVAKLGLLAICREIDDMGLKFVGYNKT